MMFGKLKLLLMKWNTNTLSQTMILFLPSPGNRDQIGKLLGINLTSGITENFASNVLTPKN